MALSPDSPRVSVISDTRAPCPRLNHVRTPPCSSSGCAVVCMTLAVVCSLPSFCHTPATPASCTGACARPASDAAVRTTTNERSGLFMSDALPAQSGQGGVSLVDRRRSSDCEQWAGDSRLSSRATGEGREGEQESSAVRALSAACGDVRRPDHNEFSACLLLHLETSNNRLARCSEESTLPEGASGISTRRSRRTRSACSDRSTSCRATRR